MKIPKPVKAEDNAAKLTISLPVKDSIGLGDVVKTLTGKLGFKPCGGCDNRAEKLNQLVRFTPSKKS